MTSGTSGDIAHVGAAAVTNTAAAVVTDTTAAVVIDTPAAAVVIDTAAAAVTDTAAAAVTDTAAAAAVDIVAPGGTAGATAVSASDIVEDDAATMPDTTTSRASSQRTAPVAAPGQEATSAIAPGWLLVPHLWQDRGHLPRLVQHPVALTPHQVSKNVEHVVHGPSSQ